MFDDEVLATAEQLVSLAKKRECWITTAESCTGGLIAGALTSIAGASACIGTGFVTYSNSAKIKALKVSTETLETYGAVSEEVAREMALGACSAAANADLALAVTGIAGPDGGTLEKPVGLVFIAATFQANLTNLMVERHEFGAIGRTQVRRETILSALKLGLRTLGDAV